MHAFETALGPCGIDWSDAGITRVLLPGERLVPEAHRPVPEAHRPVPGTVRAALEGIVALLHGEARDLGWIDLDLDGARVGDFDRTVYAATRAVEPGAVATYGEIARAIGAGPDRARAVGAALGRNPCPIVVPCHRILAADGSLHGFSAPGGLATKRRMLEIERAPGFTQQTLFA